MNDKYILYNVDGDFVYKKWTLLIESKFIYILNNKPLRMMVSCFCESYYNFLSNNKTIEEVFNIVLEIIYEYLQNKLSFINEIKEKRFNHISNQIEYVLDDNSIIQIGELYELNELIFTKVKQMLDVLVTYKPNEKIKKSEKKIREDIKLKLEPIFRNEKAII